MFGLGNITRHVEPGREGLPSPTIVYYESSDCRVRGRHGSPTACTPWSRGLLSPTIRFSEKIDVYLRGAVLAVGCLGSGPADDPRTPVPEPLEPQGEKPKSPVTNAVPCWRSVAPAPDRPTTRGPRCRGRGCHRGKNRNHRLRLPQPDRTVRSAVRSRQVSLTGKYWAGHRRAGDRARKNSFTGKLWATVLASPCPGPQSDQSPRAVPAMRTSRAGITKSRGPPPPDRARTAVPASAVGQSPRAVPAMS